LKSFSFFLPKCLFRYPYAYLTIPFHTGGGYIIFPLNYQLHPQHSTIYSGIPGLADPGSIQSGGYFHIPDYFNAVFIPGMEEMSVESNPSCISVFLSYILIHPEKSRQAFNYLFRSVLYRFFILAISFSISLIASLYSIFP